MHSFLLISETTGWIGLVVGVLGVIAAIIWGYIPKKRNETIEGLTSKLNNTRKELLSLYEDVYQLIQIEDFLEKDSGISKQQARKGFTISNRCERARIERRIDDLKKELN